MLRFSSLHVRLHQPLAIVGAGAVAQALGRSLFARGMPVMALAARSRRRAIRAAAFIDASVQVVGCSDLPRWSDHVLIAVSDDAITVVAKTLAEAGFHSGIALHTCGAKGPDALAPLRLHGVSCGMLHPLQTLAGAEQGVGRLERITFGLAGDRMALDWAEEIVELLRGRPLQIDPDRLSWYHAGAVMASNAVVAVIDAAIVLMEGAGVERTVARQALEPLLRTSLDNVISSGPTSALTGPVVRGDVGTVAAHLDALASAPPAVAALYRAVALHLVGLARERGVPEATLQAIESVIETAKGGHRS
jgi:predicted short-subunit dehydrogenase-like oxidoreductase (DUF2520 family)